MHQHRPASFNKAFIIAILLNLGFTLLEAGFAVMANSSSLLADAAHNFGDVLSIGLAAFANILLQKKAPARFSYGYKKTTVYASFINSLILVATSVLILSEAIQKVMHPEPVSEIIVIVIALIGILVNGGTALLFVGDHGDLNIRAAFLHLLYDALISFGVVIVATLIWLTDWMWLDPVVGIGIVVVILWGTWGLMKGTATLMMDAVPLGISYRDVKDYLQALPEVEGVHDLHIWGLSTKEVAMTVHLVMPIGNLSDDRRQSLCDALASQFGIHHVTIQVEKTGDFCHLYNE